MKRAHALSVGVVLTTVASAALACSSATSNVADRGPVGAVPAGLERFYGQDLSWGSCSTFARTPRDEKTYANPGLQCAYLEVPLDYSDPNGRIIKIGLLKRPASDPASRIGSLVINPGGPGGSGMSAAASRAEEIGLTELGRRFDFVGFDPRGVDSSEPQVLCLSPEGRDAERLMNLNVDSSPAGVARTENHEKAENEECLRRTGKEVLANIGTREVVRDLDVVRSGLGDEKLTYLGYSYGTKIGAGYAEAFPRNVRAMILDGAVDPAQDQISQLIGQGQGFQKAFDEFAAWCAGQAECALGPDRNQAVSKFQSLVRPLITQPMSLSDGRKLSYTDATIGTVLVLYVSDAWSRLNSALLELGQGRGDTLMRLADLYYGRSEDGTYTSTMDVFQSVLCVDNPPITDPNVARDVDARYRQVAPFLDSGQPPSPALDNCAFWPVPSTGGPHEPQIEGLPPVVVISTTQDPATPYQAGVNLAEDLNARLLTFEGTQHTAFLQGIGCVDNPATVYLVRLELPADGTRCKAAS